MSAYPKAEYPRSATVTGRTLPPQVIWIDSMIVTDSMTDSMTAIDPMMQTG
ncbi:MAG: hypothetical protein HKN47_23660 [Pirellulaceae bacterium]|nr:hypothetical protein [Pirellulaceae bacterium]